MDPSIMKLLEEDEDETMHSGADVEAFTAALNRDIEAMAMQDSERQNIDHSAELTKLQNINSQQPSMAGLGTQQAVAMSITNQQAVATAGSSQPVTDTASSNQQASNINRGKQVPFAMLLPVIQPQLDKDRAMQLNTLYVKLRKNEISKEGFMRHMRSIVGDQMLKMAVYKMQSQGAKNSLNAPSQLPVQSQAPSQQHQLLTPSTVQMMTDSSNQATTELERHY